MKKVLITLVCILAIITPLFAQGTSEAKNSEAVTLTMGSWRADDVEPLTEFLGKFTETHPNIKIEFKPTNPQDYNATLRLQLENGTGSDLFYARSYATGQELFEKGYEADLSDLSVLKNFSKSSLAPWQSKDGKQFALPLAAVSHGVYYNKDVFKELNLEIPTTWEEFLMVLDKVKKSGRTPLANGLADEWDINETFFMGILPSFVGGAEVREQYENGEKKFSDKAFKRAFKAMKEVAPYCPEGFSAISYNDSQALFLSQQAVMDVDGSWSMNSFKDANFNWGIFALPAPKGMQTGVCFHPDASIAMNAATKYPEEVKTFLEWLGSKEGAETAAKYLPSGFFPMINMKLELTDPHASEFLALNQGKVLDARFVWPKLIKMYGPMNQAVIKVMKGDITCSQAAEELENARP